MIQWFRSLDELLRGERTRAELVAGGRFELPLRRFMPMTIALGVAYGFFMGWYSLTSWPEGKDDRGLQMLAAMVKLPALFLLTLVVTFPSLYVFNALVGTRLNFLSTLRLLIAAIVVTLAVAASFGPIVAFFTLSTESYSFMVVLNVVLLGTAGLIGLGFLLSTLRKMALSAAIASARGEDGTQALTDGPAERVSAANLIFQVWVVIFGLVGGQMAWILRPFIGHPSADFQWFRPRSGNFFESVWEHISRLIGA
jgi:hypothetical protein